MAAKPIWILVGGSSRHTGSAPTIDDLLDQIRDFVYILHTVESGCLRRKKLRWLVTNASKQSPFTLELTPESTVDGLKVEGRVSRIAAIVGSTFNDFVHTGRRSNKISEPVVERIEKIVDRTTNGLATFQVDFSEYQKDCNIYVDKRKARGYEKIGELEQDWYGAPRWEKGSMEGYTKGVTTDRRGTAVLKLQSRLKGNIVNCVDSDGGLEKIGGVKVREILDGMRIRVDGLLHYTNLDDIDRIKVERVAIFPPNSDLPDLEFLPPTNITNGIDAVEYLRKLRDGE